MQWGADLDEHIINRVPHKGHLLHPIRTTAGWRKNGKGILSWRRIRKKYLSMITIFQHGEGEPPGYIGNVCNEQGCSFECVPLYETQEVPQQDSSHLIILGGTMSVNDEKEFPFLRSEKELIRRYIRTGRPVLGICLGAQMIANACGKRVYPFVRERGWVEVWRDSGATLPHLPVRATVFHWHADTFDLPCGASREYYGDQVLNQAFTLGSALGVQFHIEITEGIIREWIRELEVEERTMIEIGTKRYIEESQQLCRMMVAAFLMRGHE
jgi:GMP synthase (glutamine-hydrolysing)